MTTAAAPDDASTPVLELRAFRASRPGFELQVDRLRIEPGEAVAVCGPSGSGKSTLLAAVVDHPRPGDPLVGEGAVRVLGEAWPRRGSAAWRERLRGDVCVLPQDAIAALDPLRPIGTQLRALARCSSADAIAALETLGVADAPTIAARHPHEVSGGQAQRALLALALLRRARLCLLDEPATGLDRPRIDDLVAALDALRRGASRTALLVATHDRLLVEALGARALRVDGGRLVDGLAVEPPWPEAAPADPAAEVIASCAGVGVRLGRNWLVEHCDLELRRGENVALLGPSGAGKTTVGRVLAGLLRPARGRLLRPARRRAVQMLFQDAAGSLTPTRTPRQLVDEVAVGDFDIGAEAARIGLPAAALDRPSTQLSGGERRRAALLRALALRPELLVLDEPTAALDRPSAVASVELLLDVRARTGAAMLWITHDEELARAVADRVVRMAGGKTCSRP